MDIARLWNPAVMEVVDGTYAEIIVRFAEKVAAIEREACAKLCESHSDDYATSWDEDGNSEAHAASKAAQACAEAIRMRSNVL